MSSGSGSGGGDHRVNRVTVAWSTHEEAMRTGEFSVSVSDGEAVVAGPWRFNYDDAVRFFDDYVGLVGGRLRGVIAAIHERQASLAMEERLDRLAEDSAVDEAIGADSAWLKWFNDSEL